MLHPFLHCLLGILVLPFIQGSDNLERKRKSTLHNGSSLFSEISSIRQRTSILNDKAQQLSSLDSSVDSIDKSPEHSQKIFWSEIIEKIHNEDWPWINEYKQKLQDGHLLIVDLDDNSNSAMIDLFLKALKTPKHDGDKLRNIVDLGLRLKFLAPLKVIFLDNKMELNQKKTLVTFALEFANIIQCVDLTYGILDALKCLDRNSLVSIVPDLLIDFVVKYNQAHMSAKLYETNMNSMPVKIISIIRQELFASFRMRVESGILEKLVKFCDLVKFPHYIQTVSDIISSNNISDRLVKGFYLIFDSNQIDTTTVSLLYPKIQMARLMALNEKNIKVFQAIYTHPKLVDCQLTLPEIYCILRQIISQPELLKTPFFADLLLTKFQIEPLLDFFTDMANFDPSKIVNFSELHELNQSDLTRTQLHLLLKSMPHNFTSFLHHLCSARDKQMIKSLFAIFRKLDAPSFEKFSLKILRLLVELNDAESANVVLWCSQLNNQQSINCIIHAANNDVFSESINQMVGFLNPICHTQTNALQHMWMMHLLDIGDFDGFVSFFSNTFSSQ